MRDHRLKVFKIDTLKKVSGKEAKLQKMISAPAEIITVEE